MGSGGSYLQLRHSCLGRLALLALQGGLPERCGHALGGVRGRDVPLLPWATCCTPEGGEPDVAPRLCLQGRPGHS